jgi:hypothetical protein
VNIEGFPDWNEASLAEEVTIRDDMPSRLHSLEEVLMETLSDVSQTVRQNASILTPVAVASIEF